jgi:hypothetical protein
MFKENSKLFLVMMLLASPALSILALTGLPFIPNEKIALLIVISSAAAWRHGFNELKLLAMAVATIIVAILLLQTIFDLNEVSMPEINTVLILISLPFYIAYLSNKTELTLTYIFYIGIFQLVCSLIQQVATFNGYIEIHTLFNNYPPQHDYDYPLGEMGGFFRTSGLFNESSSYAVFQWMAIFSATIIGAHKNRYFLAILILMIAEVLINGSITGYVFALIYISFSGYRKYFFWLIFACVLLVMVLVNVLDLSIDISNVWRKIVWQFDSLFDSTSSATRLSSGIENIKQIFGRGYFLIGSGLSWNNPTHDFISLYLRGFGLLGVIALIVYIGSILSMVKLQLALAVCAVLMINGHLSTAINIILLSFCWLLSQRKLDFHRGCSALPQKS